MALAAGSLDDKYALESGRVYLTGTQALVRLPMMQRQRDRAAGLNTACYVSGNRGSPIGGLDHQMQREIGRAQSEHQSLMRISYAVFCLTKTITTKYHVTQNYKTTHNDRIINTNTAMNQT